jgi:hypothetical protein
MQSVKAAHTNGEQALDPSTFQSSEVVQTGVWDALGVVIESQRGRRPRL